MPFTRKFCPATPKKRTRGNDAVLLHHRGNDKQFKAMDTDVNAREDQHVRKLYPRDYWLVTN